uniref:FERM domain-containing protein n=1 Tax=Macrostomum lignano TaxID=282301 RepID=A0A1I8FC14_9PLAT
SIELQSSGQIQSQAAATAASRNSKDDGAKSSSNRRGEFHSCCLHFSADISGQTGVKPANQQYGIRIGAEALRDIYLAAATTMQIRFWDATARRFQQESWPLDCVTYLDLVLFQTVKGRKRHFGYFRRHTDPTDVVPDAVLVPLHKRDVKNLAKSSRSNRPILCFLVRRPYGIQFLECHAYQVEDEATGRQFIDQFDRCSADKARTEHRSERGRCSTTLRGSRPRTGRVGAPTPVDGNLASISKWASQAGFGTRTKRPVCSEAAAAGAATRRSTVQIFWQSLGISLMPATDGSFVVVDFVANDNNINSGHDKSAELFSFIFCLHQLFSVIISRQAASLSSAAIQRSASGTIFEKYKELQAFNIPECEYMGFQEMQQQLENRRQQRLTQQAAVT